MITFGELPGSAGAGRGRRDGGAVAGAGQYAAAFASGTHIVVDGGITIGGRHSWDASMVSPFATILGDLTPPAQS